MKQRILTLAALACMLLSLAACGGGQQAAGPGAAEPAQTTAPAAMSKEDYQTEVENLSADIADAMTAMGSLSITDEESARTGVDTLRSMAQPFRTSPPSPIPRRSGRRATARSPRAAPSLPTPWRGCATAPSVCWTAR